MTEHVFLTEYTKPNGLIFCGPNISAKDWADAERQAMALGIPDVKVLGILVKEIPASQALVDHFKQRQN